MRLHYYLSGLGAAILLWSPLALCLPNSQLAIEISAESVARVTLYYKFFPVAGEQFDFPLAINSQSRKFEREAGYFYAVGNVTQAEVLFVDNKFELLPAGGRGNPMTLQGAFLFNGADKPANQPLRIPVLKSVAQGNKENGIRVRFSSEYSIDSYSQGSYSNTFTLIVRPVI